MPDKIVNHFVLADGSVARYDYDELVNAPDIAVNSRNANIADVGHYVGNGSSGAISTGNTNYIGLSEYIDCESDTFYTVTYYDVPEIDNGLVGSWYLFFKDSNGTFLGRSAINTGTKPSATFKTPQTAVKMFVEAYYSHGFTATGKVQIERGLYSTDYVEPVTALDGEARLVTDKASSAIEPEITIVENDGYYNQHGSIGSQDSTYLDVYTNKIDVSNFKQLRWSLVYENFSDYSMFVSLAKFDENGGFIERPTLVNNLPRQAFSGVISDFGNARYVAFSYRTFGNSNGLSVFGVVDSENIISKLDVVDSLKNVPRRTNIGFNPYRFKPLYDHLFVSDSGERITVPHESLFHVRLSKKMGFDVIEANVPKTSDGVYFVNHLIDGKFGRFFHHVDGTTDISDVRADSVTWQYIVDNVRYNSSIPQFRTRPATLEEFLRECRSQNIVPFIQTSVNSEIVAIADKIMGVGNYIAYGATRTVAPSAIIYHWAYETTKENILKVCNEKGAPLIYGMANPTAFTDNELKDIIETLHENGFWISVGYVDNDWHKYSYMGVDANGSQKRLNRIANGNICDFSNMFGFDNFVVTGATETDGTLVFSSDGTITPNINNDTYTLCGVDIEILFDGTLTIPEMGEQFSSLTYTSDGETPIFSTIPIVNGSPKATISVSSGTTIKDISYRASKFVE